MSHWTPADIATNLWLDAADVASIVLSGSAVTQWNDKSGASRNCAQGVAASRPTYEPAGFHGKGALSFDGNDFLASSVAVTSGGYSEQVSHERNRRSRGEQHARHGQCVAGGKLHGATDGPSKRRCGTEQDR
jgi:hypothetical protein